MPQPTELGYPAYGPPSQQGYGPPGGGGYGQPPGGGFPVPPAPPTKKKFPIGIVIGAGAGVFLLVAVVAVVIFLRSRGHGPGLPVDAKYLPAQTKEVGTRLIEATREPNEQVRRVYVASELGSTLCQPGAGDPARRLEGIGSYGSHAAKEFFFNKKRIDEVQQLMECGSLLAAQLDSPYEGFVSFEDDTKVKNVMTTKLKVTEIPAKFGFTKYSFGSIKGFCRTQEDDPNAKVGDAVSNKNGECKETSHAAFPGEDNTWFLGDRTSLELMAKTVAKPRDDLSSSVAALKDAAAQTDGLPVVRLAGNPKSSKDFFQAPCFWAAVQSSVLMTQFIEGCFPARAQDRALTEIDAKLKGAAYELDGDYIKAGAVLGNIIFVARDSDGAKALEKDISDVVTDWKAHLDTNDAKLIKDTKDKATTHSAKKFAAVVDTFFTALHKMKVTRSGRTVRISYLEKLSPDDVQELIDADKSTVDKRIATSQILDAIQAKKGVPQGPLAKLVGAKWAAYLSGPPPVDVTPPAKVQVTTAECQATQKQLASVRYSDLITPAQRELYFQFKLTNCFSRPPEVFPVQRPCLASFKGAAQFSTCVPPPNPGTPANEPPESEFGDNKK